MVQRRMLKPIIAAESNPEGAPAGGISALVQGIIPSAPHPPTECGSRTLQQIPTSPKAKTFPKSTRSKQSESNLRHVRAGALGESSR